MGSETTNFQGETFPGGLLSNSDLNGDLAFMISQAVPDIQNATFAAANLRDAKGLLPVSDVPNLDDEIYNLAIVTTFLQMTLIC